MGFLSLSSNKPDPLLRMIPVQIDMFLTNI